METGTNKLRMGMVGGGQGAFIGAVHRMAAALDQQIELTAGCFSRDYENTRLTGERLHLEPKRCYRSYAEMADAEARLPGEERIDFVTIVTPNREHFPAAKAFLERGFHVVCDKPMTASLEEARGLVKLVEETGLIFALTHNYTGYPLVRHARELFTSGSLGGVLKAIVEYVQDWLLAPVEKEGVKGAAWRMDPAQAGLGGSLGDIGTHAFNLLEYMTGERVVQLCADKSSFLPGRRLDDDANILIRLQGGGKGVMAISQVAAGEENALRLKAYGRKGAVVWDQENPNVMHLCRYSEPRQTLTRGGSYLSTAAKNCTRLPGGHPEAFLEAFANLYAGVTEAVRASREGKPLPRQRYAFPTVYDGLRGLEFITAAVESSERGGVWIDLEGDSGARGTA